MQQKVGHFKKSGGKTTSDPSSGDLVEKYAIEKDHHRLTSEWGQLKALC